MPKGSDQAVIRRQHRVDTESSRVQLVDPFGGLLTDGNYDQRVDDTTTAGYTYIGKAQIGTATSVSEWQIVRISDTGNIGWAGSTDDFTNEWDERANLAYSV